jgi:acyl carrier protein
MDRGEVLNKINLVLANKGLPPASDTDAPLRDAGFRSLDFSEVALRLEDEIGHELNFEAAAMRRISTISDVIDFFVKAAEGDVLSNL